MWLFGKCLSFGIYVFTILFDMLSILLFFFFLKVDGDVIGFYVFRGDGSVLPLFFCESLFGNMMICAIRG